MLLAAAGLPAPAQSPLPDRFSLTPGQVARALCASGMPTSDDQVSLPARVVATEPDPVLDIVSVVSSRVRLVCHVPGQCLPFYAMVRGTAPASLRPFAAGGKEFTMQAGTHATLMMDDARVHLQVRVISLENGMAGKRIRVSSLDHKQIYIGEVVSASLLKGSF